MGYRSDVILAVGPEVMPQFMVTMAKSPKARELCWACLLYTSDAADEP